MNSLIAKRGESGAAFSSAEGADDVASAPSRSLLAAGLLTPGSDWLADAREAKSKNATHAIVAIHAMVAIVDERRAR
ncbi:MAG TPA: hypothetical protein VER12_09645 [Polyangiaceae bacterium]|nr:hypothetical protein [Polyangiaceae bacterium]